MRMNPEPNEPADDHLRLQVLRVVQARQPECLCQVDLAVFNGTVVMTGHLTTSLARRELCECCRHVPGVRSIVDQLVVTGENTTDRGNDVSKSADNSPPRADAQRPSSLAYK